MSAPRRGSQPKGMWVGSSLKAKTPSIEAAIKDAYEQASSGHKGRLELRVVATYVIGENPITEYRIKLGPT